MVVNNLFLPKQKKERDNVHILRIKDKKKYLNVNSHVNSSSKKPYRYKILSVVQETYFANGKLGRKGTYKDGKKEGLWERYSGDGILWYRSNWENGKEVRRFDLVK